jgi:DNA-binding XRE family transcriptional regulator
MIHSQPNDLPQFVRRVRLLLDETQEEFGQRFKLTSKAINHIEKGDTKNINPELAWWLISNVKLCESCHGTGMAQSGTEGSNE